MRLQPGDARLMGATSAVGAGLAAAGAGTVAMFALSARALEPTEYAAFAVWWTVATLLGITFGVFEAYLARLVVAEEAASRDERTVVADLLARCLSTAALLSVACMLLALPLATLLFTDSVLTALLLPVFLTTTAVQAHQRGVATGRRRFRAVALQLGADGVLRAVATLVLVMTGTATLESLAVAACLAAVAGVVVADRLCPSWRARPRWGASGARGRPLVLLLFGAVGPVLANSGSAPWLAAVGTETAVTVGAFVGALTLSRLPTQFVSAAFGPLLAELSHAVEDGDQARYDRLQRRADAACALVCALFVATFVLAGPWMLTVYLGPAFELPRLTLGLLAAASGLMLSAVVRQAGLAALDRWGSIAAAWSVGTVVLLTVLVLPVDALGRAAAAPVLAIATALLVLVLRRPASWAPRATAAGA